MIHYHGTPITPRAEFLRLAGRNFCVSFGTSSKTEVKVAHQIGQLVMLDNGAFSIWKRGEQPEPVPQPFRGLVPADWSAYYEWAHEHTSSRSTWAVIPDVIGIDDPGKCAEQNEILLADWPVSLIPKEQSAPVWHLHEPIDRLLRLVNKWPRVCFGSSGRYMHVGSDLWHRRMDIVFNKISDPSGRIPCATHMLRGMSCTGSYYPFTSVDSTDVARNYKNRHKNVVVAADRWDRIQNPSMWYRKMEQPDLLEEWPR